MLAAANSATPTRIAPTPGALARSIEQAKSYARPYGHWRLRRLFPEAVARALAAASFVPPDVSSGSGRLRELTNDEFVSVSLEAVEPLKVLAVPRAAILSDQQGDYVYVVNAQNVVEQRRISVGQKLLGLSQPRRPARREHEAGDERFSARHAA